VTFRGESHNLCALAKEKQQLASQWIDFEVVK